MGRFQTKGGQAMDKKTVQQVRQMLEEKLAKRDDRPTNTVIFENPDGTIYGSCHTVAKTESGNSLHFMCFRYANERQMWTFDSGMLITKDDLKIAAGMLDLELVDPNGPPLQLEPPLTRTDDPRWDSDVCSEAGCHIIPNLIDEATGKTWCSKHVPSYTPVKPLKGDR